MDNILHGSIDPSSSSSHSAFKKIPSDERHKILGGHLNDGKLCWLADGSKLTIIYHGTSRVLSYKNFSYCFDDENVPRITTCKKYGNFILVGMQTDDGRGWLSLFNANSSIVVKLIEVPHPVSCIEVILEEGGATLSSKSFSQNLRWLFGVIAVGTDDGHLYLIDLRLDDDNVDQTEPVQIEIVPTVVRDLPTIRDSINQRHAHLAFDLLEQCHENEGFHFVAPDDQIIETFDTDVVTVTSLFFERRSTSLFVGFSFGQFQIFDLQDLTLSFSSEVADYDATIVNFAFQEPENDPRNFCYLWVVRCSNNDASEESMLSATMFQLVYQKKDVITIKNKIISLYSDLEYCGARYDLALDPTLGLSPLDGRSTLLQCSVVEHYPSNNHMFNDDDYSTSPCTSVFVIGWENSNNRGKNVQILLFDINSWYIAHMPSCYRGFTDDQTYLAMWELDSALNDSTDNLLALHTLSSTMHHFTSKQHPVPDQFTKPSSYSLVTNCLLSTATLTCEMPGVQRQAIDLLLEVRSDCLIEPTDVFNQLVYVGLIDDSSTVALTTDQKRESILSSALDHGVFAFLSRVIVDLSSGQHAASGCTLRFIMEWAWKITAITKDSIDTLCVPIFDCSVITLDGAISAVLSHHTSQLTDLGLVFKALLREAEPSSEQSKYELQVKMNVVTLIHKYLKILRWFLISRLLPEQLEGHTSSDLDSCEEFHFVYKQMTLKEVFEKRRDEVKKLKSAPPSGLLIIDGLIDDAGESLMSRWKKISDDDSAEYPPPSLMALLDMYYLDSLDEISKHSIVTYFLLDILALAEASEDELDHSEVYEASRDEHRQNVAFFPQTFQLPPSTTKLIKAFWLLDHKQFQESCSAFCEPGAERVSLPWQHRRIMQAYMLQGHTDLALQYMLTQQPKCSSIDDVKLHIDILTKNRLTHHAVEVARKNSMAQNKDLIYSHLFSCCYENDCLDTLIKISINDEEDAQVIKYLQSSNIPHGSDLLVLYHLTRSRQMKAIHTFKHNKPSSIMEEYDFSAKTSRVVEGFINVLPEVQRETAFLSNQNFERNRFVRKEVFEPQPLSSTLNALKKNVPLSHSSLLSMVLNKRKEIEVPSIMTPFRHRPTVETSPSSHLFKIDESVMATPTTSTSVKTSRKRIPLNNLGTSPVEAKGKERRNTVRQVASMLLQTPPIKRKSRTPVSRTSHFDFMTPQSILKVKLLRGKSPSLPCLPQQPESNLMQTESGSLTSLNRDVDAPSSVAALDSSGSECETPLWMMSSVTSQEQSQRKSWMKSLFTIDTPHCSDAAPQLFKNLKGISSQNLNDKTTEQTFTPKRLRFVDLNSSVNNEENEGNFPKQSSALDNVVVMRAANEDLDVDVTGDVADDVADDVVDDVADDVADDVTDDGADDVTDDISAYKTPEVSPPRVHDPGFHGDVINVISDDDVIEPEIDDVIASDDVMSVDDDILPDEEGGNDVEIEKRQEKVEKDDEDFVLHLSESSEGFTDGDDGLDEAVQVYSEGLETEPGQIRDDISSKQQEHTTRERQEDIEDDEDLVLHLSESSEGFTDDEVVEINDDVSSEQQVATHGVASDIQQTRDDLHIPQVALGDEDEGGRHNVVVESEPRIVMEFDDKNDVTKPSHSEDSSADIASDSQVISDIQTTQLVDDDDIPIPPLAILERLEPQNPVLSEEIMENQGPFEVLNEEYNVDMKSQEDLVVETQPTYKIQHKQTNVEIAQESHTEKVVKAGFMQESLSTSKTTQHEITTDLKEMMEKSQHGPGLVDKPVKMTLPQTPSSKLRKEPIFLLSPPVTRSTRKKRSKIDRNQNLSSPQPTRKTSNVFTPHDPSGPQFVFSPPSVVRTRSHHKRPLQLDIATPKGKPSKMLKYSSPKEEATEKSSRRTLVRKGRKSPSRKTIPSPSRSSARVKLKQISSKSDEIPSDVVTSQSDMTSQPSDAYDVTSQSDMTSQPSDAYDVMSQSDMTSQPTDADVVTSQSEEVPLPRKSMLKTPTRRSTRERKLTNKFTDADEASQVEHPPTVTRASSRNKAAPLEDRQADQSESSVGSVVAKSPSRRRNRESPPVVKRTSSRLHDDVSESHHTENDDQPVVTKTPSKHRARALESSEAHPTRSSSRIRSKSHEISHAQQESQPTVTRTPSRRRQKEVAQPELDNPPIITRSSSRTKRLEKVEESPEVAHAEPEVHPTATRSSRRRAIDADEEAENQPIVTRTSSRTRTPSGDVTDAQPTVKRTSSRRRGQSSKTSDVESEVQPAVTKASSRRRHHVRVVELDDVIEEQSQEECVEVENVSKSTGRRGRKKKSPADDEINLIQVPAGGVVETPTLKKLKAKQLGDDDVTKHYTRSTKVIVPIMSRRRAKVFQWEKKK